MENTAAQFLRHLVESHQVDVHAIAAKIKIFPSWLWLLEKKGSLPNRYDELVLDKLKEHYPADWLLFQLMHDLS